MSAKPEPVFPFTTPMNWVRAAARCGFNVQPIFVELGIDSRLLNTEMPTVRPAVLLRLMDICIAEARHSGLHFPFVLGETFAFEFLTEIETYLATAPTLREALKVFDWLPVLVNPLLRTDLIDEGDRVRLVMHMQPVEAQIQETPAFSEARFAAVMKFARLLMSDTPPLTELRFRHAPPPHAAAYEPFFRIPVRFDAGADELVFLREVLDQPLKGAFPALHQQAELRVEQRLAALPVASALVKAIEQAMADEPALLAATLDTMAARLQLHPRTLQRRLRDEGQRWSEVQDRVRLRLASDWLRHTDWSIEDISEKLGFTDRRSFTQAFARWTGSTPSAFRRLGGNPAH